MDVLWCCMVAVVGLFGDVGFVFMVFEMMMGFVVEYGVVNFG